MDYHDITVDRDGGVARVVLSRPQALNALSMRLRDELEDFLENAGRDDGIDLIVIVGAETFFSAGFDLKEAARTRFASFRHRILEFHEAIYGTRKFVITAIRGIALAGGFDLALAGDLVLASPSASFGHVEVNFGINPLVFPLTRKVGIGRAAELCATGRIIGADEARALGIVDEIVADPDFAGSVKKRAQEVARMGGEVLSAVKEASIACLPRTIHDALAGEFAITERLLAGGEIYGRLMAYLESIGMDVGPATD